MVLKIGVEAASVNQIIPAINNIALAAIAWSGSYAAMVTAEFIGREQIDSLKSYIKKYTLAVVGIAVLISVIFALLGKPLAGIYSTDKIIIKQTVNILWIMVISNLITTYHGIKSTVLSIGGDVRFTSILSMSSIIIKIPVILLFTSVLDLGIYGMFVSQVCIDLILAIIYTLRYNSQKWLHMDI